MIKTWTPCRISLAGGGSDTPVYSERHGGLVVSFTIDKGVTVSIVSDEREQLASWNGARDWINGHFAALGLASGVSVGSYSEIDQRSGLGVSSAFSVGLLRALYRYKGEVAAPTDVARLACELNMRSFGRKGIGFQDEYACAYGGLNAISFAADGVSVESFSDRLGYELATMLMLIQLPVPSQPSSLMMQAVNAKADQVETVKHRLKQAAIELRDALRQNDVTPELVGDVLARGWELKKRLTPQMTTPEIDKYYKTAMDAGALGGKVSGAGGGGYLLLCVPREKRDSVREAVGLKELRFNYTTL